MSPIAGSPTETIDFVKELRLRRWAREHYVRREQRDPRWHPFVLEEMQLKDAEVREYECSPSPSAARPTSFVPLAPDHFPRLHTPHTIVPDPNVLNVPDGQELPATLRMETSAIDA